MKSQILRDSAATRGVGAIAGRIPVAENIPTLISTWLHLKTIQDLRSVTIPTSLLMKSVAIKAGIRAMRSSFHRWGRKGRGNTSNAVARSFAERKIKV